MSATSTRRSLLLGAAASGLATASGAYTPGRAAPVEGEFAAAPMLDAKQSGHLRHVRNVLWLEDGEWGPMVSNDPRHAGDHTGYQYQLSGMAHVLAQAHYHRLPAASGFFKADMDRAVHKLLHPDVWGYWFAMSQGSRDWNPDLKSPQTPWWDPVVKENIMYSGHLNHVAALYAYMFSDDKYDRPGSLGFRGFQNNGFGPSQVEYSLPALNDLIYWQMAENGFMGVACMPNSVFVTCNQFPIWGFRFQDLHQGTHRADEVVADYFKAWARFGGFKAGQETPFLWWAQQNRLAAPGNPLITTQAGGPMASSPWTYWALSAVNPNYVRSVYPYLMAAALARDDDGSLVILHEREMAGHGHRFGRGEDVIAGRPTAPIRKYAGRDSRHAGIWGWTSLTMSEQGDPRLQEILAYVDAHMNPTWRDGGLYYPRNDATWVDGRFVGVAPTAGNANYGYARLNVKDGLRTLYAKPWTRAHFEAPHLAEVSREVDVARAWFAEDRNALIVTIRPPRGSRGGPARLAFANVQRPGQAWKLFIDSAEVAKGGPEGVTSAVGKVAFEAGRLIVDTSVSRPTDLVIRWA